MKTLILFFLIFTTSFLFGQTQESSTEEKKGYEFSIVHEIKTTPIKNQHRSGTCWSFATVSFVESELLRMGQSEIDLSEMFIVRKCYEDKADKFVRMHGKANFSGGGAINDVFDILTKYGMMPEEAYSGLQYGTNGHVHGEIDRILKSYVETIVANPNKELSTAWKSGYNGILNAYFGVIPNQFEYEGQKYTPEEFAKKYVPLNAKDYVYLTSFTHHPFFTEFILEIPDNWSNHKYYNIPIDDLIAAIDHALEQGYSVSWAADVSEKGFSWKNGVAIIPETAIEELSGSEKLKWETMTKEEIEKQMYSFDSLVPEKNITQQIRQIDFDNYKTTDDHLMHIVGLAKDQNGNKFYKVKNSWGSENHKYEGFIFVSESYMRSKTIALTIHKDALTKDIKKRYDRK